MKMLLEIFKIFFITGLQLIGGGYVIFPLLKNKLVEEKKWLTEDELIDYLSLSQCLPGIIALNISIFSGWRLMRLRGAIVAVFGLLLPAFLIILALAGAILYLKDTKLLDNAFHGVRLAVIVLIFSMIKDISARSKKDYFSVVLFGTTLIGMFFGLSPVMAVVIAIFSIVLREVSKNA